MREVNIIHCVEAKISDSITLNAFKSSQNSLPGKRKAFKPLKPSLVPTVTDSNLKNTNLVRQKIIRLNIFPRRFASSTFFFSPSRPIFAQSDIISPVEWVHTAWDVVVVVVRPLVYDVRALGAYIEQDTSDISPRSSNIWPFAKRGNFMCVYTNTRTWSSPELWARNFNVLTLTALT